MSAADNSPVRAHERGLASASGARNAPKPSVQYSVRVPGWGWMCLVLLVLLPAVGGVASFSHLRTLNTSIVDVVSERRQQSRRLFELARLTRETDRRIREYTDAATPVRRASLDAQLEVCDEATAPAEGATDHDLIRTQMLATIESARRLAITVETEASAHADGATAREALLTLLAELPAQLRDAPTNSKRDEWVERLRRLAGLAASCDEGDAPLSDEDLRDFEQTIAALRAGPLAGVEADWVADLESGFARRLATHSVERAHMQSRRQAFSQTEIALATLRETIEARLNPKIDDAAGRLASTVDSARSRAGTYFAAFTLLGLFAGAVAVVAFSRSHAHARWVDTAVESGRLQPNEELEDLGTAFNRMVENLAHSESLLREKEARLRMILETAADGIVTINQFGAIESFNAKAKEIFGFREVEVLGKGACALMPEPFGADDDELERYLDGEVKQILGEVRQVGGVRKDGTTFPMEMVVSEARVGKRTTYTSIVRDITERRAVEERQAKLIEELESKNAEMERFTYTVSHDLKSPLITIRGFLGLLEKDMTAGNTERVRADLTHIHSAVANMQNLLSELLELSRVGRIVSPPVPVRIEDLVNEALDCVAGPLAEKGVTVSLGDLSGETMGDSVRLIEVFQNLIENAVKFMGAENAAPRVSISVQQEEHDCVCIVEDNGIGIDPRYHDRVFGLFERLDQTNEGTGIGLALVKRIVELHGGSIKVESEGPGHGSRFCVRLPKKGKDDGVDA